MRATARVAFIALLVVILSASVGCDRLLDVIRDLHDSDHGSDGFVVDCGEFAQWSWQDSLLENASVGPGWVPQDLLQDSVVRVYRFTLRNPDGSPIREEKWYLATANERWYCRPGDWVSIYGSNVFFKAKNFLYVHPVSRDSAVLADARAFLEQNQCIVGDEHEWSAGVHAWEVSLYCALRPARQMRSYMPLVELFDTLNSRPDLFVVAWRMYVPHAY